MEKIKVYGEKNGAIDFIATIYVDKDNKVIVEAKDTKVKEDLEKLVLLCRATGVSIKSRIDTKDGGHKLVDWFQKPGDPDFLVALRDNLFLITNSGEKCGEYELSSKALARMEVVKE